jgi:signal transduction histidine kinase
MTAATAQALANSLQHAGAGANRLVRVKASNSELKIIIRDDGKGFRVSRIPKTRLGVRLSIIERVERVGGRVFIDTSPGAGTTIILEWDFK